jgi:hypothetical protein
MDCTGPRDELPREARLWQEELERIRGRADTLGPAARIAVCRVLADVAAEDGVDGVEDLLGALRPGLLVYGSSRVRSPRTTSAPRARRALARPRRSTATT